MTFRWPNALALSAIVVLGAARQSTAGFDVTIDDSDALFTLFQGTLQSTAGNDSYGGSYHFIENWGGLTQDGSDARSGRAFYFLPTGINWPAGDHLYNVYAWMPDVTWSWHVVEAAGDGTEDFIQDIDWAGQYGTNKQWLKADPQDPFAPEFDPELGGRWLKLGPGPQSDLNADGGSAFHINPSRGNPYFYLGYQQFYDGIITFDALRVVELVPEPASLLLLLGFAVAGVLARPRRGGVQGHHCLGARYNCLSSPRKTFRAVVAGKYAKISLILRRSWLLGAISLATILAVLPTGCRRHSGPLAQEKTNLSWLGQMYGRYISQNQGQTPKTVDDLRKFVEKKTDAERLTHLKVATVGELFVSPRDGKPFKMVSYDKLPQMVAGEPPPVVLYETEGKNGSRAIAFLGGVTRYVDDAEFQKLLPPQVKRGQ